MFIAGSYLIPVMVTRGASDPDSKILLVNSGVHGDELNGIRVVQMLFDGSIPASDLTGTLIGIPGINQVRAEMLLEKALACVVRKNITMFDSVDSVAHLAWAYVLRCT